MSEKRKSACRRYLFETFAAMALYLVVVFAAEAAADNTEKSLVLMVLSFAPLIPMGLAVFAFFRYYRVIDERERKVASDAAAITLVVAILAAIGVGFLQDIGAFAMDDAISWFGPFMIVAWALIRLRIGGPDW